LYQLLLNRSTTGSELSDGVDHLTALGQQAVAQADFWKEARASP
jgi:hypothetical protein